MGQLIPKYPNNKDVLPCKGPFIHHKCKNDLDYQHARRHKESYVVHVECAQV